MNWLTVTLAARINGIDWMAEKSSAPWKKPVRYTLCIRMNMDTKNRRVGQSIPLSTSVLPLLKMRMGADPPSAMRARGMRADPVQTRPMMRIRMIARETRQRSASFLSVIRSRGMSNLHSPFSMGLSHLRRKNAANRLIRVGIPR